MSSDDKTSNESQLSKSLTQISMAYEKQKDRLNRDLNKMEYQVAQIKDTRDRISMQHIKSLDIVSKEVERIMPQNLSQMGSEQDNDDEAIDQAIRKDLENEDVFSMAFRSKEAANSG